jgi:hypothetical protein
MAAHVEHETLYVSSAVEEFRIGNNDSFTQVEFSCEMRGGKHFGNRIS